MIGFLFASILTGTFVVPYVPLKPVVIVTNVDLAAIDVEIVNTASVPDREAWRKERGYAAREFEGFTLYLPPNLLGVDEAKSQASLLKSLAARSKEGGRTISVAGLGEDESRTLRGIVADHVDGPGKVLAASPDLKLRLEPVSLFKMSLGEASHDLWLHAPSPGVGKDDARMTLAPSSPPGPIGSPSVAKSAAVRRKPTSRMMFLVPRLVDGVRGLEWIAEAQNALLKEAREAKAGWTREWASLLDSMQADIEKDYANYPTDRPPRFSDLSADCQAQLARAFEKDHRRELGGKNGLDWLSGAKTTSVSVQPSLQLRIDRGGDGKTYDMTAVDTIRLRCPIGP